MVRFTTNLAIEGLNERRRGFEPDVYAATLVMAGTRLLETAPDAAVIHRKALLSATFRTHPLI